MRDWSLGARLAIALFVCQIASPVLAAPASDVVVMPFRCTMSEGKPVLTPVDEDLGHPILGAREQKKIKTCSTVDAKRCRQWTAFKFDMDCDGTRVSWMQVFANASEHTRRRVWEHNGRLRVRDTKVRNPRVDDICARRLGPAMEWSSTSELCDEVSTATAPTATDMPAGYAPMVGLDAVILPGGAFGERGGRTVASTAARTAEATAKAPRASEPAQAVAAPAPPRTEAVAASAAEPADPSTAKAKQPAPVVTANTPGTDVAPEPPLTPVSDAAPSSPAVATEPPAESATSVEPPVATLTTSSDEATAPQVLNAAPTPEPPRGDFAAGREPAQHATAPRIAEPSGDDAQATSQGDPGRVVAVTVQSPPPDNQNSDHTAYLILAFASGLSMIALLSIHWFGSARTAAAIGNDGAATPKLEPAFGDTPQVTDNSAPSVTAHTIDAIASIPPGQELIVLPSARRSQSSVRSQAGTLVPGRPSIGDRLPSTKNEALELLGMGVATDNNLSSLKKIIDGLRMNWHPDHAADEADRLTRELRLKQINAAWEILGGKTAGA